MKSLEHIEGAGPRSLGRYQLLAQLGSGGMAAIYLARIAGPAGFERPVAVKVIHDHLAQDPQFVQMFLGEAKIAANLSHPNIVQVHDLGEEGGTFFIAMEYLAGHNLAEIVRRARATTPGGVDLRSGCLFVQEACEGLHHAHETTDMEGRPLDLVHRDISPQNIFVTYDGGVKLMDFGIARAAGIAAATRPGSLKGKFSYMSPEQARGEDVDRRTDVFAMGIVLWEVLAGRRLFKGSSDMDTLGRVARAEVPALSAVVAGVPASLNAVVARALALRREDRFASAADMHDALAAAASEVGPPVKARAVAATMSSWFAAEKSAKRELLARASRLYASGAPALAVDAPARAPGADEDSGALATPSGWRLPSVPSVSMPAAASGGASVVVAVPNAAPRPALPDESPPRRRWGIAIGLAAVLVVLLAVAGMVAAALGRGGGGDEPRHGASPATASAAPVVPAKAAGEALLGKAPPAVALPAAKTVTLTLSATPGEARFALDGVPLAGNPYSGVHEASATPRTLRAAADGFEPVERSVVLDESLRLELALVPAKVGRAPRGDSRPAGGDRPAPAGGAPSKTPASGVTAPATGPAKGDIYTTPPWER